MTVASFNNIPQRIGKFKGEIIAHAEPVSILTKAGAKQYQIPKNSSKVIIFRRWLPYGGVDNRWVTNANVDTYATNHLTVEGVTPTAESIVPVDVQATLNQYACLYAVTDQIVDLLEDDVPAEMKKQVGERIGLLREMVAFGVLKGATNRFYAGGTSRATVAASLTLTLLRRVVKNLKANHAKMSTSILNPGVAFGTSSVEAAYLVFGSTDMEPAIRDLPGFIPTADYGSRRTISDYEIGSVESFRFILSPELVGYADAGAAVGTTGLFSTTGTNVDVYPLLVVAEDAWATVALRGSQSLDVTWIPPGQKDKNDPLGQRGFVGAKTYMTALILNQGWMAVVEAGTPSLA